MLCSNYKFLFKKNLCYYFNTYYLYVEMLHSCNNVVLNWIYESCQNDFLKVDSLKWFICQQIKIFGWIDWEAWIKNCEVLFFFWRNFYVELCEILSKYMNYFYLRYIVYKWFYLCKLFWDSCWFLISECTAENMTFCFILKLIYLDVIDLKE
jgi:hypothetical protein